MNDYSFTFNKLNKVIGNSVKFRFIFFSIALVMPWTFCAPCLDGGGGVSINVVVEMRLGWQRSYGLIAISIMLCVLGLRPVVSVSKNRVHLSLMILVVLLLFERLAMPIGPLSFSLCPACFDSMPLNL